MISSQVSFSAASKYYLAQYSLIMHLVVPIPLSILLICCCGKIDLSSHSQSDAPESNVKTVGLGGQVNDYGSALFNYYWVILQFFGIVSLVLAQSFFEYKLFNEYFTKFVTWLKNNQKHCQPFALVACVILVPLFSCLKSFIIFDSTTLLKLLGGLGVGNLFTISIKKFFSESQNEAAPTQAVLPDEAVASDSKTQGGDGDDFSQNLQDVDQLLILRPLDRAAGGNLQQDFNKLLESILCKRSNQYALRSIDPDNSIWDWLCYNILGFFNDLGANNFHQQRQDITAQEHYQEFVRPVLAKLFNITEDRLLENDDFLGKYQHILSCFQNSTKNEFKNVVPAKQQSSNNLFMSVFFGTKTQHQDRCEQHAMMELLTLLELCYKNAKYEHDGSNVTGFLTSLFNRDNLVNITRNELVSKYAKERYGTGYRVDSVNAKVNEILNERQ